MSSQPNLLHAPVGEWFRPPEEAKTPVAPVWHTIVLIAGIVAISASGPSRVSDAHGPIHRLPTYAITVAAELALLAWVLIGLRLRRIPFRSLLGACAIDARSIGIDLAFAGVFWILSLMLLGTLNLAWLVIESAITHHPLIGPNGQPTGAQAQTLHTLSRIAPSSGLEIAAWVLVCITAGIVEEIVFRGYLQRQFIAWGRGRAAVGVVFSALIFGAGHGYEGLRNMVLIAVFGALFSLLALARRSLRAGIIAHCWQDLIVGLLLAALKSMHAISS